MQERKLPQITKANLLYNVFVGYRINAYSWFAGIPILETIKVPQCSMLSKLPITSKTLKLRDLDMKNKYAKT